MQSQFCVRLNEAQSFRPDEASKPGPIRQAHQITVTDPVGDGMNGLPAR